MKFKVQGSKFKVTNSKKRVFHFLILLLTAHCFLPTVSAQIAVKGEQVWTMTGDTAIQNGVVLIGANGKIEKVGAASAVQIPSNYRVVNAKVVTPGLIDAHSTVGLSGYLNQVHDQMQLDGGGAMQPELRAIDAYNPQERLVTWIRSFGVTTINTGHAPGAAISGQTTIAKTIGETVDESVIVTTSMVVGTMGQSALAPGKSPGTRGKLMAILRNDFLKAQEYQRKFDAAKDDASKPSRDMRLEMMARLLKREIPFLVTAHRAQDIVSAIRLAKEFNLRLIIDGAAEAHLVLNEIKASGFPVIIHPTMMRGAGEAESMTMENAMKLKQAGILTALQSGFEAYVPKTRIVLFEAAAAASNGLNFRDALALITIDAAKILNVEARIGSLETGKDGDVAMYDGDPFEFTTHCTGTIINGKMVSDKERQ
ncbi:MAG: amidohydrolase family protein [Pyrinomonadaceae bacterium]|nr:amidohydrolase family protein [Pyrinomonadaceae bacterium]